MSTSQVNGDPTSRQQLANRRLQICVVGSGTRFLSGISYYTHQLAIALATRHQVTAILMRNLLPRRLYPGRDRVGLSLTHLSYAPDVDAYDGVDWSWLPSVFPALRRVLGGPSDVMILQWWTGTVLHTYLLLAALARLRGTRVVVEFHEVLDTGELNLRFARTYVRLLSPVLMRLAAGFVVHSEHDRAALSAHYSIGDRPISVIPHGPYAQFRNADPEKLARAPSLTQEETSVCQLLYFGVIRPFKGVENLIQAFDQLSEVEAAGFHLTVVGETWEDWNVPAQLIAQSRFRDRITFINRYVTDDEVSQFFAMADAVVLPYHRSSASGPLHIAMSHGLPVIVTQVGGLIEASAGYAGAVRIPPRDPDAIKAALLRVSRMRGERFTDPHSWDRTLAHFDALFEVILEQTPTTNKLATPVGPPN